MRGSSLRFEKQHKQVLGERENKLFLGPRSESGVSASLRGSALCFEGEREEDCNSGKDMAI